MNKKEKKATVKCKKVTEKKVHKKFCTQGESSSSLELLEDEMEISNVDIKKDITYGQRKQDRWVGFLRCLLDNPTKKKLFSVIQREVLRKCTKRDAIPRKRVKFCNFVKHIYGKTKIIPLEVSSSLFDKIKREFSKTHSNTRIDADDPEPISVSDQVNLETIEATEIQKKIKSPKSRKRKSDTSKEDGNEQEHTVDNDSNRVETKKSKITNCKATKKNRSKLQEKDNQK